MDKISIIVAYRNRDLLRVKRFLNSLNNQTNKDFELIFVDSGTELLLANEIEKQVSSYSFAKYIYNDSRGKDFNRSLFLNIGAKIATGDFFYFTDIDLIFHEGFVNHLHSLKNEYSQVYTRVYMINEKFKNYDDIFNSDVNSNSELNHTSGKGWLMVPKTVFYEIGGYDEYYTDWGVEDNDIYIRLCQYGLKETWTDHTKFPVYHQWHPSNERFHIFPEKWLDDISFHYIINQKKLKRNLDFGKWVKTEDRTILAILNNNSNIPTIEIAPFGLVATKTLHYRKIWDWLSEENIRCFKIIVPVFRIPKMSFAQSFLATIFTKILKAFNSPYSLQYFQKKERHKYFLPEEDIKWFFRKLVKETNLINDYYIMETDDKIIYYVEKSSSVIK